MKNYLSLPARMIVLVSAFICCDIQLQAQPASMPVINQQKEHQLNSTINNKKYQLFISLPKNYAATDTTRYPVLYLLDGNYTFPIAHATRQLLDFTGSLEEMIIVGIGYTWDKSYEPWYTGRWNDLTISTDTKADTGKSFLATLNLKAGSLTSGGADQFIMVLKKEIIPFIEKNYKSNGDRGLEGHSLGGLFTAYCLLQEPKLFNRYGINSPSVWWDNEKIFAIERSFAEKNKNLDALAFITVGNKEGEMMLSGMKQLADSLKAHNYAGLNVSSAIFEDEGHFSVVPASISRTLRMLYRVNKK